MVKCMRENKKIEDFCERHVAKKKSLGRNKERTGFHSNQSINQSIIIISLNLFQQKKKKQRKRLFKRKRKNSTNNTQTSPNATN